jgi:hypothetical protein
MVGTTTNDVLSGPGYSPVTRVASIGAYEIVHALKEGGMGEVLLARRRGPGGVERLVAIKTIRAELAGAASVRAMFLDEAGILSRLGHPAVAAVHDFGEDGGALFLVMEYVAGIPFRELIDRRPPPAIAARAIAEACRGVHAAHELQDLAGNRLGVVHRDISPENLMLGFDGHVKVIDFGIALVRGRQAPVTELGTIKGKPPYMSPEQLKNEPIDRQSDVFSLAVVLHELLTGRNLFEGDSIYAVALAVEQTTIAPPSTIAGALPPGLDAAVMRGLARDRARRFPTAAAMAEELEAVVMASGGETLEAWSARELAAARTAHREWLSAVVTGVPAAPIGRPTGAVTALPEPVQTPVAPAPAPAPDPVPRRARAPLLVLLLVLLGGGGLAFWLATRDRTTTTTATATATDAATVTATVTVTDAATATATDAATATATDAATATATTAPDARTRITRPDTRPDRPPPTTDARTATATTPATGTAYLSVVANPFANVHVDGKNYGLTPFWDKKVPAGKRHIVLTSGGDSDKVVYDKIVELAPGQKITISP